jgi:hypothetical protein
MDTESSMITPELTTQSRPIRALAWMWVKAPMTVPGPMWTDSHSALGWTT